MDNEDIDINVLINDMPIYTTLFTIQLGTRVLSIEENSIFLLTRLQTNMGSPTNIIVKSG